ncbi:alanine racemase [Marinobacterium sp. xm-d-530]|uniref:alanine racemase n=1 Tax=Marinobacterium sp. xm-d-530 TaxID=2497747 RepID=UPI00156A6087|nr:alanine racemase [Marinobacterium sp. xm-d-530]NRQ02360.1 Alanine racemase, biosynthetic [Marinobacterium sp. xm-d-530]
MPRPLVAEIDLAALKHNLALAKQQNLQAKTLAVVKANAYGHGAVKVALALESDADAFGVASIEEALELREGGLKAPVLLLEGCFSEEELASCERQNFWVVCHSDYQIEWLIRYLSTTDWRPQIWLKVDSGMHRLGFDADAVAGVMEQFSSIEGLPIPVMMSHFACADQPAHPRNEVAQSRFNPVKTNLSSFANSAGIFTQATPSDSWQRLGIGLYGGTPSELGLQGLQPAMTLKTAIIALRDILPGESVGYGATYTAESPRKIATIAIGYADGYPRQAKQGTPVLVNGVEAPIVGRVSMDMITVDVTDLPSVSVGDEVIMFNEQLLADRVAKCCDTIDYTLFAGLTARVPRRYSE